MRGGPGITISTWTTTDDRTCSSGGVGPSKMAMIGARHERSHRSHAARRAPNVRGERISVAKAIGGPRGMERIPDGIGAASMGGAKWQGGRRWSMIGGGGSIMDPGGLPGRSAASARSAPCLKEASGRVTSPRAVLALPRARGCASFRRKSTKNPFKGLYSIKERSGGVFSAKKGGFSPPEAVVKPSAILSMDATDRGPGGGHRGGSDRSMGR